MRRYEIIEKWLTIQRPNRWLIVVFLIFLTSGTALADDPRVKVVDGKTYFNGTEAEARKYVGDQVEQMRVKAQAEADVQSAAWRQRMDAAASGHPDANFVADNKANFDLDKARHPENFTPNSHAMTGAELQEMSYINTGQGTPTFGTTLNAKPMTLQGSSVGLSGFDEPTSPTPTVQQSSSSNEATAKQSAEAVKIEVVKTPEIPKPKTLVSYEARRENKDRK